MDMSLDEVISSNKSAFRTRRGGGGGRGRGRGRGGMRGSRGVSRGGRGAKSTRGVSTRGRGLRRVQSGGITKQRRPGTFNTSRQQSGPVKLNITNLDYGVSDSDISELFSEFGSMKTAVLHYDRTGRSLGTAHVIFERMADAIKASDQYNEVHLDGRPMKITMDGPKGALTPNSPRLSGGGRVNQRRGGNRPSSLTNGTTQRGARRGGRGGRGGFSRGGRRGRGARKQVSAEQLDAELEAYAGQANK